MSDLTKFSRRTFMVMPLALAACKPGAAVLEITGFSMGTTYNMQAIDSSRSVTEAELRKAIDGALLAVNHSMSNWDANSEISRFNALSIGETLTVSPELAHVMQAAESVNTLSEGRFDTTVGPLIEAWGFGTKGDMSVPSDAQIASAMAQSGHADSVAIDGNFLTKTNSDAQVYLSAIGKGFGADHVGQAIEKLGITDYMIEIGGDLYASGRNPQDQPWQVGIEKPAALFGGVMDVVGVSGMGLASSGDYRNYFEADGQRYSHLIDPMTGRPVTHSTASTTVLADNAMLADAWSTAMLILGREKGLEIANANDIAVLFIDRDGDAGFSTTASDRFAQLSA